MAQTPSRAPDFKLQDEQGRFRTLSELLSQGPLLVVFYPGDFTPVCTKQLCSYRDAEEDFSGYGIQVVGISADAPEKHRKFKDEYGFKFTLLADPGKQVAQQFGAVSTWILGAVSRAVFIVGRDGEILYRHVESTPLTRRKPDELKNAMAELRSAGKL